MIEAVSTISSLIPKLGWDSVNQEEMSQKPATGTSSEPLFQCNKCGGEKSGMSWILKNQQFNTYQLSENLPTDRMTTVSTISR